MTLNHFVRSLIEEAQKLDKCTMCEYHFNPGENMLEHYALFHSGTLASLFYMDFEEMAKELEQRGQHHD